MSREERSVDEILTTESGMWLLWQDDENIAIVESRQQARIAAIEGKATGRILQAELNALFEAIGISELPEESGVPYPRYITLQELRGGNQLQSAS